MDDEMKESLIDFLKKECRKHREIYGRNSEDCDKNDFKDYVNPLLNVLQSFIKSGLSDGKQFSAEIIKGNAEKIRSRIWEAQLYNYLNIQNLCLLPQRVGPDFSFINNGRRIWIEAVTPQPMDVPNKRLITKNGYATSYPPSGFVPEKEFMLRWTSAISRKNKKFKNKYIGKNIVQTSDVCIIAISSIGMEEHHPFCFRSISNEPSYALKVAYGLDGISYNLEKNTFERLEMYKIKTQKGEPVSTAIFCDLEYEDVSAILAAKTSTYSSDYAEYVLIHNVNARNNIVTPENWTVC